MWIKDQLGNYINLNQCRQLTKNGPAIRADEFPLFTHRDKTLLTKVADTIIKKAVQGFLVIEVENVAKEIGETTWRDSKD